MSFDCSQAGPLATHLRGLVSDEQSDIDRARKGTLTGHPSRAANDRRDAHSGILCGTINDLLQKCPRSY
jgi:hypothetical protein